MARFGPEKAYLLMGARRSTTYYTDFATTASY
jgi:hypothetical protein